MTLRRREQLTHAHTLTCTLNGSLFITVKNTWQCSNSVVRTTRRRRRSFYCGILLSFIKVVVVLCSFSYFASCLFAQLSCDLFVLLFLWFFGVSLMSHAFSKKICLFGRRRSPPKNCSVILFVHFPFKCFNNYFIHFFNQNIFSLVFFCFIFICYFFASLQKWEQSIFSVSVYVFLLLFIGRQN